MSFKPVSRMRVLSRKLPFQCNDCSVAACIFFSPVGKIIFGVAVGAGFGDFDIFIEHAEGRKLLFANGPKVKMVGLWLKGPKILGEFLLIILIFGVVGAEGGGYAHDHVLGLGADVSVHRFEDAGVDVLGQASPSGMGNCNGFMNGIVENRCLAIGVNDA